MDLIQLQDKLEIKNDINNLIGVKLFDKYGRNLNDVVKFLKNLNVMFIREPNYPLCITEEQNKLLNYILLVENKYSIDLVKSKTTSIKEKMNKNITDYKEIKKMNKLSDEAITKEMDKIGNKFAPSLNIKTYPQMVNVLYEECKLLNDTLKKETSLPSVKEIKEKFNMYNDYARNADFIVPFKLLDNLYQENPLLDFCYDEKFLLLTNYILNSHVDNKTKDKIVCLTKDIINTSINIRPNEFFNGEVNKEEYITLAKQTLNNIRDYVTKKEDEKNKYEILVEENKFVDNSNAIYTTIKKKIIKKVFK